MGASYEKDQATWRWTVVTHQLPHLLNNRKSFRIRNDRSSNRIIRVTERGLAWEPALGQFGPITTLYILAQLIDVVLRITKHDRQHELPLWIVLERIGYEFQVL